MSEEEVRAVKTPETGTPETKAEGTTTQQTLEEPKVGSKEYNWRQMEKRLQEQELRNRELETTLQKLVQPAQRQEEELPELSPNDIPEWKNVTTYAEKIAEKKFKQLLAEKEKQELPTKVRQKFTDFDQVVTPERVKELEKTHPELAGAISTAPDPYSAAYSALKILHQTKGKVDESAKEEAEKILENAKKPASINSVGRQGALSNASSFAKKSKDQLYKEMLSHASRI